MMLKQLHIPTVRQLTPFKFSKQSLQKSITVEKSSPLMQVSNAIVRQTNPSKSYTIPSTPVKPQGKLYPLNRYLQEQRNHALMVAIMFGIAKKLQLGS